MSPGQARQLLTRQLVPLPMGLTDGLLTATGRWPQSAVVNTQVVPVPMCAGSPSRGGPVKRSQAYLFMQVNATSERPTDSDRREGKAPYRREQMASS
jgi:hypothetical protein